MLFENIGNKELQPKFVVSISLSLDGDDWPPTMTENARAALIEALDKMKSDGLIMAYSLKQEIY